MDDTAEPDNDALPPGTNVAGYEILRVLSTSGLSIVYEAQNATTLAKVALKESVPHWMARREGRSWAVPGEADANTIAWTLQKFEAATHALCRLEHPNIPRAIDYLRANDTGYMVMELLDGETLDSWLHARLRPPSWEELRPLVVPVMDALSYLHERRLFHRDVAPDNILVTRERRPILIDFGSLAERGEVRDKPVSTIPIATLHYTAPEQMRPNSLPAPEGDTYAMGAVIYRALLGERPTAGLDRIMEVLIGSADLLRPLTACRPPDCPPHVARAIDAALALRPEDRPASMAELREALAPADERTFPGASNPYSAARSEGVTLMVETDKPDDCALPPGTNIAGHVIRRVLGTGGFSIVYEAENRVTGAKVAIKEFFPAGLVRRGEQSMQVSDADAETIAWALDKFERSATTLHELRHPNIVEVQAFVPANGTGYMILEMLEGETLLDWLKARQSPPTFEVIRPVILPIIEALAHIHGRGMIHRDVAPDNILITRTGRPVLIGFTALSADLSAAESSDEEVGICKPHYTAPDQIRAKVRPTPQADVYSMGATLHRALTGGEPADGRARMDNLFMGEADPYQPLVERRPATCPEHVAEAIDKALAIRPDHRHRGMAELRAALRL